MKTMRIHRADGAKPSTEWSQNAGGRSRPGRGPRTRRTTALATGIASTLMVGALSGVATAGATPAAAKPTNGRVDLYTPTFSNPLNITNPLFPKGPSKISQTVALGTEPDTKLRFEATQLDQTRTIAWNGKNIMTRVTSFVAYHNGRLVEVASDFYAQDDKGAVWYFGEDVANYDNGVIKDHAGTWLAGKDGPPGMIMPAKPKVGDVFRPENAAPLVFEEATVEADNLTVPGPSGAVKGAIRVRSVLLDGTVEEKIFAPRYGEFRAEVKSANELYFVALAVPTDSAAGPVPAELSALIRGAYRDFGDAAKGNWVRAARTTDRMNDAWEVYKDHHQVPSLLKKQMNDALKALGNTVRAKSSVAARQAAIDVSTATLDLQLRYRGQDSVDTDRLTVWKKQLQLDTAVGDAGAIAGDRVTIHAIKARINH